MPKDITDMKEGFVPVTPGGTVLTHLGCDTEQEAWKALLIDAAHMPYADIASFKARGYTVEKFEAG